jgi:hypothetical protein
MLHLVEKKASTTIMTDMFKGLLYFEKLKTELIESKSLVHTGLFNQKRTDAEVKSWKSI